MPVLSLAILCIALAYFWAMARRQQALVYLLKPATMALIAVLASEGLLRSPAPGYAWAVVVGLLWSLAGDILLMLPSDQFRAGLVAFAVAHLFYIWGLWRVVPRRLTGFDAVMAVALALAGALACRRLAVALRQGGEAASGRASGARAELLPWVIGYAVLLSLMVWRALATLVQPAGLPLQPGLVVLGGLLFYASDLALAWDRFVWPLPRREWIVMGSYFAAQYCLAASVAWPPR